MKLKTKLTLCIGACLMLPLSACNVFKNRSVTSNLTREQSTRVLDEDLNKSLKTPVILSDTIKASNQDITWNEMIHKFETAVPSGPPATFKFVFTNKGTKPVKIKSVEAACSCTASDYSREDVAPGSSGWVVASYKTANTFGYFNKYIEVEFEGDSKTHRLYVTGTVDPYNRGDQK